MLATPLIALRPDPRRPLNRGVGADAGQELRVGFGQVIGEQEIRARTIRTVHGCDGGAGQRQLGIQTLDFRIIPLGDVAQINAGHRRSVQVQLTRLNALDVHHRHDAADDHGELQQSGCLQIVGLQGHVRGAERHRLRLDLLDSAARSDGLIVETNPGELFVGVRPFRVNRVRNVAPAPEISAAAAVRLSDTAAAVINSHFFAFIEDRSEVEGNCKGPTGGRRRWAAIVGRICDNFVTALRRPDVRPSVLIIRRHGLIDGWAGRARGVE